MAGDGGGPNGDDDFLARMQSEWRLLYGTDTALLRETVCQRIAEPLLAERIEEEAAEAEARAAKRAEEEAKAKELAAEAQVTIS